MHAHRQVLFWLAALLLVVLAILTLKDVLLPFLVGMVIAYALNPIADRLGMVGVPRVVSSALIVALLFVVVVLALIFLVPPLLDQVRQFAVSLPSELERLKGLIEAWARERLGPRYADVQTGLDRLAAELSVNWGVIVGVVARSLWAQSVAIVNFLALLLITPLVIFYLLVDWHRMLDKIDAWLPRDHKAVIRRLAGEIDGAIAAFIRGQGLACLILGIFYSVGLSAIGLRYGLLVGIATGVLSFVPFVGWALGLMTATALAIVQFWPDPVPLLQVLALFALAQVLDAAVLSPKIVGSKIGLHPVWVIMALFVFSYLFGFAGVLVAVPVAAAIGVLVRFSLELYLASPIYRGTDADGPPAPDVGAPPSVTR